MTMELLGYDVKSMMKAGPLWIGFIVMLLLLLGVIKSPLTELDAAIATMKRSHDLQLEMLREICRQGAKTEFSMATCNQEMHTP